MNRFLFPVVIAASAVAGCSSGGNGVSTASILGNAPTPPAAGAAAPESVAAVPAQSTPTDRAFQVGTVTARAAKCGFNFDGTKLKAAYMAHEIGRGATNEQMASVEKIHNVAYNGVTKAAAEDPSYCSDKKTPQIKADLARLLGGDFEPPKKAVVAKKPDDEGFFGGLFSSSSEESGPKFGSGDWWDSQREKGGG